MSQHQRRVRKSRKNRKLALITALLIAVAAVAIVAYVMMNSGGANKNTVLLITSMGDITIKLRDDMPITTTNFKNLVQQGKYDGTIFNIVMANFIIQGGQINSSWPTIQDEFGSNNHNVRGTIAMAKTTQPNSASTQFFINVGDNSANFDSKYGVFGDVIKGMNIVDAISKVPVVTDPVYGGDTKPAQDVVLIKAELLG